MIGGLGDLQRRFTVVAAASKWLRAAPLLLLGCSSSDLVSLPATTTRVATPISANEGQQELVMHIFEDRDECAGAVDPKDVDLCMPYVDRATGQVRVAFQMRVDGEKWAIPLPEEGIDIFHKKHEVKTGGMKDFQVVPHDPQRSPQLFVLLIDGSGSMAIVDDASGKSRMDKLKAALLDPDVVESFFPTDTATSVVPLVFAGAGQPQPLGGKWVVQNKKEYRQLIRESLQVGAGYTYLYNAVDYGTSTLLEQPEIKAAVDNKKMQPTLIVLTDGFNNERPDDTCGANAPRLQAVLKKLDAVRRGETVNITSRPVVYTVGLGVKAWRNLQLPKDTDVKPSDLCRATADQLINGGVENRGVDNAALGWIARTGGGASYVKRDAAGLAEAFKAAAAMRYGWFEVRYKVDPYYLRRTFETKVRLTSLFRTEAAIQFYPSGWFDAPPGPTDAEGWARPPSFTSSLKLVLPTIALFAAFGYLPSAWFNLKRALFARVVRRRK